MKSFIPRYEKINHPVYDYVLLERVLYYSKRYHKTIILEERAMSDGATGAFDIDSLSWWVHDHICKITKWSDDTPITAWQASNVLSDILFSEGRYFRAVYWKYITFFFGCTNTRKNGWF